MIHSFSQWQPGQPITTDQAMELAMEVAREGLGFVSPNPPVGCVIVDKRHCFLTSGAHLKWGETHAEINAINKIRDLSQLEEATIYTTLEPCSHTGKTGSCARTLAKLPIKKVYYGVLDPHPKVSGQGLDILKSSGKEVSHFKKYQPLCQKLCEQFLFHINNQSPFVALKVGTSLDGKIALPNGESQWITSRESRRYGRQLRGHYDATLIGAGTLLKDDPALDFRGTGFEGKKKNRIIIFDPKGKVFESFNKTKISQIHSRENIFVLTDSENFKGWSKNGVHVIVWDKGHWQKILRNLYKKAIFSLFVEGGAYVFGQMLKLRLPQKLYLFQSPKILGSGLSWSEYFETKELSRALRVQSTETHQFGKDRLHISYFVVPGKSPRHLKSPEF